MKTLGTIKFLRLWVYTMLMAFAGQSFAAGIVVPGVSDKAGSDNSRADDSIKSLSMQMSTDCHKQISLDLSSEISQASSPSDHHAGASSLPPSCCDDDCKMSLCSGGVVTIVNSFKIASLESSTRSHFAYQDAALSYPLKSLFRPPIFG